MHQAFSRACCLQRISVWVWGRWLCEDKIHNRIQKARLWHLSGLEQGALRQSVTSYSQPLSSIEKNASMVPICFLSTVLYRAGHTHTHTLHREWCRLQWAGFFYINQQSRQSSPDMLSRGKLTFKIKPNSTLFYLLSFLDICLTNKAPN